MHPCPCGKVVAVLGTAVQHDDEGAFTPSAIAREVESVAAAPGGAGKRAAQELCAVRDLERLAGPGPLEGIQRESRRLGELRYHPLQRPSCPPWANFSLRLSIRHGIRGPSNRKQLGAAWSRRRVDDGRLDYLAGIRRCATGQRMLNHARRLGESSVAGQINCRAHSVCEIHGHGPQFELESSANTFGQRALDFLAGV